MSPRAATTGGAEPAHDAVIDLACRALRLPTIRERCAEFAADATREHASYRAFLAALLTAECDDRDIRRRARRSPTPGSHGRSGWRTSTSQRTRTWHRR